MKGQQYFSFVKDFSVQIDAQGHITPKEFLRERMGHHAYYKAAKKNPEQLEKELQRITSLLKKSDCGQGHIYLLPGVAMKFLPDNFFPQRFVHSAKQIQEDRAVYKLSASKVNGARQNIMIKAPKVTKWSMYSPPEGWLTNFERMEVSKSSKQEVEMLLAMKKLGFRVEEPLGYFEQGIEQYIYTKFVRGKNPLDLLSDRKMRKKVWEADARLLAQLCKAGIDFQYFYSPKFDDKMWVKDGLVLIDTDEARYMRDTLHGDYFEEHPDKLPAFYTGWLQDCLSSYLADKLIKEKELLDYAKVFYTEKGDDPALAEQALKDVNPDRVTKESELAMMMECD